MRLHIILVILFGTVLTACSVPADLSPTLPPDDLIQRSAASLLAIQTLRVTIDRTGADYGFDTIIGPVIFNRMTGQFVAPDTVQATARVALAKLPVELDLFAQGEKQWVRGVFSNNVWQSGIFAPGFNPQSLVTQAGSGLQGAMTALNTLDFIGETQLEDGTSVYHVSATADGVAVSALLVDIVEMTGKVQIDVYIEKSSLRPLKFVIVQPDTITELQPDPTTWTIELYDFDAPAQLNSPPVS